MDAACAWKRTPLQSLRSVYGLRTHDRAAAAFARCFKAIFRICDQKASSLIVKRHGIACRRLVDTVNTILVLLLHLRNHSFQLLRSSSPGPQECTKRQAQAPRLLARCICLRSQLLELLLKSRDAVFHHVKMLSSE